MTPTPELLALRDVCARLDGAGIAYMLTSSLATSFYARPRMTRDIDLVVALEAARAEQLAAALGADYHVDSGAVTAALRAARPWNIIHVPSIVKIDLIPRKDTPYRRAEFERRRRVELAGVPLWIARVEDLILSEPENLMESGVNDTSPDIEALLKLRYAAMSGSERALMALQMFETAQQIVLSSLDPALSEGERRRELCRRFYGVELARAAYPKTVNGS